MRSVAIAATIVVLLGLHASASHAQAPSQSWQMPPDNQRCPSQWGAGDQRGSGNMMKPETVLRASKLIKTGEVFELGALLSPEEKESFINRGRQFNIYTKPALPNPTPEAKTRNW